jgi:hypothetical protein
LTFISPFVWNALDNRPVRVRVFYKKIPADFPLTSPSGGTRRIITSQNLNKFSLECNKGNIEIACNDCVNKRWKNGKSGCRGRGGGGVPAGREVNCQTKEEERDHHPETNGDSK